MTLELFFQPQKLGSRTLLSCFVNILHAVRDCFAHTLLLLSKMVICRS